MRRASRPALAAMAVACVLGSASAPRADHNPGDAPLTISQIRDLRFGRAAGDGTSSSQVRIDSATGNKTVSGGAYDFGGPHGPARFRVKGEPGHAFLIVLPADQIALGQSNPSNQVTVASFESTPSGGGVIGQNGKADILVGATLELTADQPADDYDVTVPLEVIYP